MKVCLLVYWKPFVNMKEIKKPSYTLLRVWAKNQLRCEPFEKSFLIYIRKSQFKIEFQPIYIRSSGTFAFYTALENNTSFLQQFFRLRGIFHFHLRAPLPLMFWALQKAILYLSFWIMLASKWIRVSRTLCCSNSFLFLIIFCIYEIRISEFASWFSLPRCSFLAIII